MGHRASRCEVAATESGRRLVGLGAGARCLDSSRVPQFSFGRAVIPTYMGLIGYDPLFFILEI